MTQTGNIKKEILRLMDSGVKDKIKIYDIVQEKLQVPRPTIRRAARTLRLDLAKKAEIIKEEVI